MLDLLDDQLSILHPGANQEDDTLHVTDLQRSYAQMLQPANGPQSSLILAVLELLPGWLDPCRYNPATMCQ